VLVALRVPGAAQADLGVAGLLAAAALVAVASGMTGTVGHSRLAVVATSRSAPLGDPRRDGWSYRDAGPRFPEDPDDPRSIHSGQSWQRVFGFDGATAGAALATAAVVLALASLGAVVVPGVGLVITTLMVLVVSLGVLAGRSGSGWAPGSAAARSARAWWLSVRSSPSPRHGRR
jgi:hypothetical protein